jgi:undecaprenyl pyrophosphate phosphatase UppP
LGFCLNGESKQLSKPQTDSFRFVYHRSATLSRRKLWEKHPKHEDLDGKIFRVGFFQAMAIFPGVSRSGSTITGV